VRIGGQIQPPTLVRRVEPTYPPTAVSARLQGIVILEAVVDEEGTVKDVKVLRSVNPLLDREALAAVRQWRYSPVVLNGTPVPFVLSVSLSFSLQNRG
jgi:protein TonB